MPAALMGGNKDKIAQSEIAMQYQLYIGHEIWNLVIEMMLVIRSAIKSLKKLNHPALINQNQFPSPILNKGNSENFK